MEFKIGDRILYNGCVGDEGAKIRFGKIIGINVHHLYCVEFNNYIEGCHEGQNSQNFLDINTGKKIIGKSGHCWYVERRYLKIISSRDINKRMG